MITISRPSAAGRESGPRALREVSAVDRRIKIVVATEAGARAIRAVRDDMQSTHQALDLLDDHERTVLYELLTRLRPVLEQAAEG